MQTSLIVVDDFLDTPEGLRAAALRLDYPDLLSAFPGRNSFQRIDVAGLTEQVSDLTGDRLKNGRLVDLMFYKPVGAL